MLCRTIQNKRYGMLTFSVLIVLLHDSMHPHTVARARALRERFNWELFGHPSHSPDLTLSDYHLFTYLKNCLGSQCSNNNEELMEDVKTWLNSQASDFFDTGIQNLFPDMTGASIPMVTMLRSSLRMYVFFVYNFFFLIACFVNSSLEVTFRIALVDDHPFWVCITLHCLLIAKEIVAAICRITVCIDLCRNVITCV
jgi:hypothetical protein